MSGAEEETFKAVELGLPDSGSAQLESAQMIPEDSPVGVQGLAPSWDTAPGQDPEPAASAPPEQGQVVGQQTEKGPIPPPNAEPAKDNRWASTLDQFKMKKFFVLRPGTMDQAIQDISNMVDKEVDGTVSSIWLLAEVDHWNNEKERVAVIAENSLLVCKYDFVMLQCELIQKIPLNYIDRVSHGEFSFPPRSLLSREGEGVRVYWDRSREPSFSSRWNPFSTDYPFMTFTYHPVRNVNQKFADLCELHNFREALTLAAQQAHTRRPIPGKANGVLVLNQPLLIEAYVGLMSFVGNQNKLGYCLARGNIGF